MRAQNYRPKVHTGTPAKRRTVSPASPTTRSRTSRRTEPRGQGARVMWILMIAGGLIGSGFVMAQHSQINVHQLKQTEEKVKTQLDEMTNQQRYLALEKERAINTQESERIAREAGLMQPKLDRSVAPLPKPEPEAKPQPSVKAAPTLAAKPVAKPGNKLETKIAPKPAVNAAKPAARAAMLSKSATAKLAALPKPSAKLIAAKPVSRTAPADKPVKSSKSRQLAQKQETKKEKRR